MSTKFTIADVPFRDEVGSWHVPGRCLTDIHIGNVFRQATPYEPVFDSASDGWILNYGDAQAIELRVSKIIAYRREWEYIDAGMTAMLILDGNTSQDLQNHSVLSS